MKGDLRKTLFEKEMTRKEFLQFVGVSLLLLSGLPNFLQLIRRTVRPASATDGAKGGFGSRRFGD